MSVSVPLKYFGGKSYLAPKIVALFPKHLHYVEPYFGGGAVLLERDPNDKQLWVADDGARGGVSEVVGDLNGDLVNFWRVLRDPIAYMEFTHRCRMTPLSRSEWWRAGEILEDTVGRHVIRAWAFFVRCRQSRAGGFKSFTSLTRNRTRRGVNGNASEWLSAVDGLPAVHARLEPVVIEEMPALGLICREDGPLTLQYLDPPYLHETRVTTDGYAFEMTDGDHQELLDAITDPGFKSKVILSGYDNPMYAAQLASWTRHTFDTPSNTAGGKEKARKTEVLWCNF